MKKKNKIIKLKTRHSVAKRFRLTKTGKVLRRSGQNRHLKANRSRRNSRRKRALRRVENRMAKKIKKMLGK